MKYLISYCITMLILYVLEYLFRFKSTIIKRLRIKRYYIIMLPVVILLIATICTIDYTLLQQPITAGAITALGGFTLLINQSKQ